MGIIKKWGKIIIAVVVFMGILSLVVRVPMAERTRLPTPYPTPDQVELPTPTPTVSPVFAPTPEPTELPTTISTPIPVETPKTIPIPSETPLPISTSAPLQTSAVPISASTPSPTPSPISPPLSSSTPPPKTSQDSCTSGHEFRTSVWETATCLKGGYYNNVCQRCGLVESVTEEPLPHDVEDILIQEGNCMQDTIIRHICKSCGQQVQSDTRYTPEVHKWICAVVDDKEVFYCEWCGIVQ